MPGISASLALTKTLPLICDIRKGRLSDVPAHLKLVAKLLQSGCLGKSGQLHLFVSLTSKATYEYWSAHALCTSECWTLLGLSAIFFMKCSNVFSRGSRYQEEEQANRGTAEACFFHSSICDPDPSSEGDWDTSVYRSEF